MQENTAENVPSLHSNDVSGKNSSNRFKSALVNLGLRHPEITHVSEVDALIAQSDGLLKTIMGTSRERINFNRPNARLLLDNFLEGQDWALSKFNWKDRPITRIGISLPMEMTEARKGLSLAWYEPTGKDVGTLKINFIPLVRDSRASMSDKQKFYGFDEIPDSADVKVNLPQLYFATGVEETIHYLAGHNAEGLNKLPSVEELIVRRDNPILYLTHPAELDAMKYKGMSFTDRYGYNPFANLEAFLSTKQDLSG